MGKWKYPQWAILALVAWASIYAVADFSAPAEHVEVYRGEFGPWTLRLGIKEKPRPGEDMHLVAWVSSPSGRPNYKALRARLLAGEEPAGQTEFAGSVYERRGRLPLPPEASPAWRVQLDAELWNGQRIQRDFALAPFLRAPANKGGVP